MEESRGKGLLKVGIYLIYVFLVKIKHWVQSIYGPSLNSAFNFALKERHMGVFCLLCVFGESINCDDNHKLML